MRIVHISEYEEKSMVLAKPVYDSEKRILLAAGQRIHSKLVERFQQMNISFLFIDDSPSRGITMEDMMDMPTWIEIVSLLESIFNAVKNSKPFPIKDLFTAAGNIISEVQARPVLATIPSNTLPKELKWSAHSVNVAILALQIGRKLKYNDLQLRDLTVGCLLHDIGKSVTENEQEHPKAGFQILREIREISLMAAHVAFQHHEMMDGGGFPRGISGNTFLEIAQICSLANMYEHFVSDDAMPPHLAAEKLMVLGNRSFSLSVVQAFTKSVPQYLPGTLVRLSSGVAAIVTRIGNNLQRPYVRILSSEKEISLEENLNLVVSEVLQTHQIKS